MVDFFWFCFWGFSVETPDVPKRLKVVWWENPRRPKTNPKWFFSIFFGSILWTVQWTPLFSSIYPKKKKEVNEMVGFQAGYRTGKVNFNPCEDVSFRTSLYKL